MSSKGRQAKLTAFLAKPQDGSSPKKNKQRSTPPRPRQARLDSLPGVVKLPKMSGHANDAELHRLLDSMDPSSSAEDIIQAMKQAACYEFSVDQLESVPLGKRVKALRQHGNPEVQQQAVRLLQKMRQDVKDACSRTARAKPILAHLTRLKATKTPLDDDG